MHDTRCLGLVHWDDPEGWYREGGGGGGSGWGSRVYPWQIHVDVELSLINSQISRSTLQQRALLAQHLPAVHLMAKATQNWCFLIFPLEVEDGLHWPFLSLEVPAGLHEKSERNRQLDKRPGKSRGVLSAWHLQPLTYEHWVTQKNASALREAPLWVKQELNPLDPLNTLGLCLILSKSQNPLLPPNPQQQQKIVGHKNIARA